MNPETRTTLLEASKPVRYAITAVLVILAIFLVVKTLDAMSRFGEGDNPVFNTITVNGEGESEAVPDIAKINFTVDQTAATVAAAQEAATTQINAALAAMQELEIAEEDIKTKGYTVYPQYAQVPPCTTRICPQVDTAPRITGYQVSQSVEVKVRDTDKVSDVLARLGGLNVQNISGPNFMVDDDSELADEARNEAIADAHEKAEELADQLGVRLDEVVSFYEEGQGPMPYYSEGYGGTAMDASVRSDISLPTGQEERTVNVQITYRIK